MTCLCAAHGFQLMLKSCSFSTFHTVHREVTVLYFGNLIFLWHFWKYFLLLIIKHLSNSYVLAVTCLLSMRMRIHEVFFWVPAYNSMTVMHAAAFCFCHFHTSAALCALAAGWATGTDQSNGRENGSRHWSSPPLDLTKKNTTKLYKIPSFWCLWERSSRYLGI